MHRKTIEHPLITAKQAQHFLFMDVLPFFAAVVSVCVLVQVGTRPSDWISFVVMWLLGVVGIELGYHRYFTHSAFKTTRFIHGALVVLGSMGGQGPVVTWAATHRHHHNHADEEDDSHSPHKFARPSGPSLRGFLHAQVGWKWKYPYPNPSLYTPHLLRDELIAKLSRYYYLWVVLGIVTGGVISGAIDGSWRAFGTGMMLGGVLRLFLGQHATFAINSLCHLIGSRPFESKDRSRNIAWMVPWTLGGSLHNAHHAFPSTANNALLPGQVDPGFWVLRTLERLGLAWDLRIIKQEAIDRLRAGASKRTDDHVGGVRELDNDATPLTASES